MKEILFLIEGKDKKKIKILETKLKAFGKNHNTMVIPPSEKQLYYENATLGMEDYICLLNEDMDIDDNFLTIIKEYELNEVKAIYLPLVILSNDKAKGVLNNCLWNSNLAEEVGYLDHNLSLKQIDTTLYGSLIPVEYFNNDEYYNKEMEYYQHFYFLNKYTSSEENIVVGVPKILCSTTIDLSFQGVDDEVKVKNFKLAREVRNKPNLTVV